MSQKQYDNTNRFILGVNPRKRNDKDPDRTGTLNVDGEFWLNGWLGKDRNGQTILTGSIKRKETKPADPPPQTYQQQKTPAEDDVPF